ncbi:pyridoxamine 5'-phosphate oxidase [Patiriisocius sp. Uisw_017]|jgi:pyridoxamine 5'-phosphate oxidase|uniref:pyridoxamine 5'-phosphate oxidase n=1 Tax=Patiriisocius sp. Uisw_017 TaxID=3230968 RepID=UPI0039EB2EA4
MDKSLHEYRKSYTKGKLDIADVSKNPMKQFNSWFQEAESSQTIDEVNAMTISTVDASGMPRNRVVLLKEVTFDGFVFYTNYKSKKGIAIAENPLVSLSFFWPSLERQIIIQGRVEKISEEKSKAYFNTRPRDSKLGALVSEQSQEIASRSELEKKLAMLQEEFKNKEIIKPKDWGGYLIKPLFLEFWQGRSSRLHDRICYAKNESGWDIKRLQP